MPMVIERIPVPPDAVRVWRGHALASQRADRKAFCRSMGSVFMPVTVQLMGPLGLTAYLPAIMPPAECPDVPDEIALVFYRSQAAYTDSSAASASRAYSLLHRAIFDLSDPTSRTVSRSGFPCRWSGGLTDHSAYFLLDEATDWFMGATTAAVATAADAASLQRCVPGLVERLGTGGLQSLDGAVLAVDGACLCLWVHSSSGHIEQLQGLCEEAGLRCVWSGSAGAVQCAAGLFDADGGFCVADGDFLNVHFPRGERPCSQLKPGEVPSPKTTSIKIYERVHQNI